MKRRKLLAGAALLGLALLAVVPAQAQDPMPFYRKFLLFAGADVDSNVQVSRWIPTFGAKRVMFRIYSDHIGFGGNADSARSDSLQAFTIDVSDSVGGILSGPEGNYNFAADSFTVSATFDSSFKNLHIHPMPVNRVLRAPANGSGIQSWVYPLIKAGAVIDNDGLIGAHFMRVSATPLRRNTANGTTSTQGLRVNGLRGFTMYAYVFYGP